MLIRIIIFCNFNRKEITYSSFEDAVKAAREIHNYYYPNPPPVSAPMKVKFLRRPKVPIPTQVRIKYKNII